MKELQEQPNDLSKRLVEEGAPGETADEIEIVKQLEPFEKETKDLEWSYLLGTMWSITKKSLAISASIVGGVITQTGGLASLNAAKDTLGQACFGIYGSYVLVFYIALTLSLLDKIGISVSSKIGEKDFEGCRRKITQGAIACSLFYSVLTLPLFLFAGPILGSIGVDPVNADFVWKLLLWSFPYTIINLAFEFIKTICMAQGCESIFGYFGFPNAIVCVAMSFAFVIYFHMGAFGWILSKTIFEITNLGLGIYVLRTQTNEQARSLAPLSDSLDGLKEFLIDAFKFTMGSYSEMFGFEFTSYFVAIQRNNNMIAAYGSMVNFTGIVYCLGASFSVSARTRANILIGMGKSHVAKNFFLFFVKALAVIGAVLGLVVYGLLLEPLCAIYASANMEMYTYFKELLAIYCLCLPSEVSLTSSFVGMKTIGRVMHLLTANVVVLIIGNGTGGFAITKIAHGGVVPLFAWLFFLLYCLNIFSFYSAWRFDWSVLKSNIDKQKIPENDWEMEIMARKMPTDGEVHGL